MVKPSIPLLTLGIECAHFRRLRQRYSCFQNVVCVAYPALGDDVDVCCMIEHQILIVCFGVPMCPDIFVNKPRLQEKQTKRLPLAATKGLDKMGYLPTSSLAMYTNGNLTSTPCYSFCRPGPLHPLLGRERQDRLDSIVPLGAPVPRAVGRAIAIEG